MSLLPHARTLRNASLPGMARRVPIILGVFLAGALVLSLWMASRPREPIYEGRPLTSWLERHVPTSAANPPYNSPVFRKADDALREIGTNAIPTLLQMIRAKDPPPALLKLLEIAQQQRWIRFGYRYASSRNEEAEYAFK